ncbi:hypothetical protein MA16_Dca029234 [Dendrobium catenatum]|uniref:Uncharacterized protein n=1 Tax=Dendrobium catenatum TaxID=906689 RepID=A0A2I0VEJ1_9ASPA|nr:hypothetical protein MA16_Dca029234 [Dendrobium catenatum]
MSGLDLLDSRSMSYGNEGSLHKIEGTSCLDRTTHTTMKAAFSSLLSLIRISQAIPTMKAGKRINIIQRFDNFL